jgi:stage III sporulation protein AB
MLQLVGSLMVGFGCLGLGYWYRFQAHTRIRHLREMMKIVDVMMSEIRYHKSNLYECCRRIADRVEMPYRQGFLELYEKMMENTGENYRELYENIMEKYLKTLPLQLEERKVFLQIASENGFADEEMQLLALDGARQQLHKILDEAMEALAPKSKVAMGLGVMSGLLLIILLL